MKKLLIVFLLVPFLTLAQSEGEIVVGTMTVSYDSTLELESGLLYYQADELVASKHPEVTLVYKEDVVVLEAYDTDDNGELDTFLALDAQGVVSEVTGEKVDLFERPAVVEFAELLENREDGSEVVAAEEDLVGSLDAIIIPRYRNYTLYGFILIAIAGVGFWWYRRKSKVEAD